MNDDKYKSGSDQKDKVPAKKSRLSMHEDVDVSNDGCCSCEAEPYWLEAMEKAEKPGDNTPPENMKKD